MANPLQLQLGANLRALRAERGMSQEKLGEFLGIDRTYVGALERGERNPSLRVVQDLADGLGVLAIELLDGETARAMSRPVLRAAASKSAKRKPLPDARASARQRKR